MQQALLSLKKRQSRREERGLVYPNEQRATLSGAFLGSIRRTGVVFLSSFAITPGQVVAHSVLLGKNIAPAEFIAFVTAGPNDVS